ANATPAEDSWNGSSTPSTATDGYATAQPPAHSTSSSCSRATTPSPTSTKPASPTGSSRQPSNKPHANCSSASHRLAISAHSVRHGPARAERQWKQRAATDGRKTSPETTTNPSEPETQPAADQ